MKNNMIKETKSELKKVVWPSRKQVINGTVVVIVMVAILGVLIFAFDLLSGEIVKKILSNGDSSISNLVDHVHDYEETENTGDVVENNSENSVEENSEPTIDNNEVTE
jgi:preprotein translocase SecE subunit